MKPTSKELVKLLFEEFQKHAHWPEVVDVVRRNTIGNRWLAGSAIYKTLVRKPYNRDCKVNDWDFFVDSRTEPFVLPEGWEAHINSFGNPKLKKAGLSIDLVPLATLRWIVRRGLEPTINNFLAGTPLDVQSIALNIDSGDLIGEDGLSSIFSKTVKIHNREEYDESFRIYGIRYSLEKYKNELNFEIG